MVFRTHGCARATFFFIILFRILPAIVSQTANCEQTPRAEHSREVRLVAAGESAWIVCS